MWWNTKHYFKGERIDSVVDPKTLIELDNLIERLQQADLLSERVFNSPLQKIDVLSKTLLSLPEDAINISKELRTMANDIASKISELTKQL